MPGYGDSDLLRPLTWEGIADRLVGLLDQLQVATVDLVGLSFGGMHALHTALRHPERVRRLVLADSSPAFGMDGTDADVWMRSRLDPLNAGVSLADAAPAIVDAITASPLTGLIREEVVGAFGEIPVEGFRAAVECLPTNDVRPQLGDIGQPTLVIVGELDEETPVDYARILADGINRSRLEIIEGVGHLSPSEAPARFNGLVTDFLSSTA